MMAAAAAVTVAEVENLVEPGALDPDHITRPASMLTASSHIAEPVKHIEKLTVRPRAEVGETA